MTWIDQLQAQPLWRVAEACGLQRVGQSHIAPCPACGESRRSASDRRKGPVYVVAGARWKCGRCDAGGDAVGLIACGLFRQRLGKGDPRWAEVRAWGAAQGWCDGVGATSTTWVPPRRDPDEVLARPPADQVLDLWAACRPAVDDDLVAGWLQRRLAVEDAAAKVTERDLVRALPRNVTLPPWATYRGQATSSRTWGELGHRAIVAMRDADGAVVSLRARCVADAGDVPKALPPVGYSMKATIMCNTAATGLLLDPLAARADASLDVHHVVVAEGEPQWLAWCLRWPRADRSPVFGLVSGSWSPSMATAIPSGAQVVVCTDDNQAGDNYARTVRDSLQGRASVLRWQPRRA